MNIVPRNLDICVLSAFYKKALIPQLHFLNAGFLIFCRDEIVWIDAFLKLFLSPNMTIFVRTVAALKPHKNISN